jgi:hypothetical protein
VNHTLALVSLVAAVAVVLNFARLVRNGATYGGQAFRGLRARLVLMTGDAGVVTLAQAALNAPSALDTKIIDEFRKNLYLFDALPIDQAVTPAGGGATLTYGYMRQITQRGAGTRAINSEYTPTEATKAQYSVNLKPVGGAFQIDRVLDGIAQAAETEFQMRELIKATSAEFVDLFINGDTSVDANAFDGISKALTGTTTELGAAAGTDWTAIAAGNDTAFGALDIVDELVHLLDGPATLLIGNSRLLAKFRGIARRAGYFTRDVVQVGDVGVEAERFGNVLLVDPGTKPGSSTDIVPVTAKTVNSVAGSYTDLYAVRLGLDGVHAVSTTGTNIIRKWLPDFTTAGAVKTGEVELGPIGIAIKKTKAVAVRRNIRLA